MSPNWRWRYDAPWRMALGNPMALQSAVEPDAPPVAVLRERRRAEVEARLDLDTLVDVRAMEQREQERLAKLLAVTN